MQSRKTQQTARRFHFALNRAELNYAGRPAVPAHRRGARALRVAACTKDVNQSREARSPARPALPEGLQLLPGEEQLAVGGGAGRLRRRIRGPAGFRQLALCLRQLALRRRQLASQPAAQRRARGVALEASGRASEEAIRAFRRRKGRLWAPLYDAGSSLYFRGCMQLFSLQVPKI